MAVSASIQPPPSAPILATMATRPSSCTSSSSAARGRSGHGPLDPLAEAGRLDARRAPIGAGRAAPGGRGRGRGRGTARGSAGGRSRPGTIGAATTVARMTGHRILSGADARLRDRPLARRCARPPTSLPGREPARPPASLVADAGGAGRRHRLRSRPHRRAPAGGAAAVPRRGLRGARAPAPARPRPRRPRPPGGRARRPAARPPRRPAADPRGRRGRVPALLAPRCARAGGRRSPPRPRPACGSRSHGPHRDPIVGYAVTGRAGPRGYLQRLAVDPPAQGARDRRRARGRRSALAAPLGRQGGAW